MKQLYYSAFSDELPSWQELGDAAFWSILIGMTLGILISLAVIYA